jgi:hypothetical protein
MTMTLALQLHIHGVEMEREGMDFCAEGSIWREKVLYSLAPEKSRGGEKCPDFCSDF